MSKVKGVSDNGIRIGYRFNCPGCDTEHVVNVYKPSHNNSMWSFNENMDSPTFSPSINIAWGKQAEPDFVEPESEPPKNGWSGRCHSFITDGIISFCGDCTHSMSGKTIELPEIIILD